MPMQDQPVAIRVVVVRKSSHHKHRTSEQVAPKTHAPGTTNTSIGRACFESDAVLHGWAIISCATLQTMVHASVAACLTARATRSYPPGLA